MKFLCVSFIFLLSVVAIYGKPTGSGTSVAQPKAGAAVDEVVVESSLYIKNKPQIRRTRDVSGLLPILANGIRVKRQNRHRRLPQVGSSQSAANAAANSNFFGPKGFGGSAANAQAQGFQSQGPLGGFGASAANTQTQSFTAGPKGIQGAAGASGSQTYNLPDGRTINVALSSGFSAGQNGINRSNANGITIT